MANKTKIMLIPSNEHFGNEEEAGELFNYDMLNWHIFWEDETEVDTKFENYFKNMLRAMLNLQGLKITISINFDLEKKKLILGKVWAEFTTLDGTIIFPKNYEKKDDGTPVENIWQLFTGLTGDVSKLEWINIMIRKLKDEYSLLKISIKEDKQILESKEELSSKLVDFLLLNNF